MDTSDVFDSYNAGYAQLLYEQYLRDPASVDEGWRRLFATGAAVDAGLIETGDLDTAPPTQVQLRASMAAAELVDAYRLNGHFAAQLDPLGNAPRGHPMLDLEFHGIRLEDLDAVPADLVELGDKGETLADVLEWLRRTYTGTIGYEYEHLEDPERREWLREEIESWRHRRPLETEQQLRLLQRLSEVEAMEQFLHRAYLGHKRFSVEGTDMLVPMLDLSIERAAEAGAGQVVLGMAHRGRLNVLAHVLGRPYSAILAEFEGQHAGTGTGDVKYHLGAQGTYATVSGDPLTVTLAPNPSHLEFVDPVVEGIARARQMRSGDSDRPQDEDRVLPVLIHGDAAFSAQGVVAETLNLSQLEAYRTGGTLHFIVNNQIGFTTEPHEARSTHYASDLARGFGVPIFHVNADDPEACLAVVRLALGYRARFHGDVVIDLIGYRRYGHNEGDEPAYTQPLMYERIQRHPTVRQQWAAALVERGVIDQETSERAWEAAYRSLSEAQEQVRNNARNNGARESPPAEIAAPTPELETAFDAGLLLKLDRQLHTWPEGFNPHPKLARQLERRASLLPEGQPVDWAHAESLALASLLAEGVPIRLTGQDTLRGTFSQRHLQLRDVETGLAYLPLADLEQARASIEAYNSPLSEVAALGFEYGYSISAAEALVIWEAQFGDFGNAAQVIIDQFMAAGRAKWGQQSRLVMLLPHGYEGQGPEHSSARLERFLQLTAEDNIRVANCSTPAQYFHLLRRQALLHERRPLVVMTPKSLLRHPRAVSRLEDLADGRFSPIVDDADAAARAAAITRLIACTGKVYYDLTAAEARRDAEHAAIIRIEQLYPFHDTELAALIERYANLEELVWVQEEPENMGAWRYLEPLLRALTSAAGIQLGYVGRPKRASPAEGYAISHEREQGRIVRDAFAAPAESPARRRLRTVEKGSAD